MSGLISSDPLATLAMQSGMVRAPLADGAAQGDTKLDTRQRAAVIGEPVPIVFCRRDETAGTGGVLISPAATEARFSNDASNAVTASYHLVLSEGQIGSIQVRDVFQRSCRVGTHTQTYNRRAGTWSPGNFIVDRGRPPMLFYLTEIPDMSGKFNNVTEHIKRAEQYELIDATVVTDPDQLNHWPFKAEGRQYMWDYNFKQATLTNPSDPEALSSWYIPEVFFYLPTKYIPGKNYKMPEASYYCGSVGTYTGMSTLSFQVTIPDGFDQWNRQVHCFIRNGMQVTRLLDNVTGSSNNFADLYHWALVNCAKLTSAQIDYASLANTARFLHVNGFNCDINISNSQNLGEMAAKMAPYFLVTETRVAGRRGLRPMLPVNSDGTIKTTPVEWAYTFTEDHILPDQLQINYVPSADRQPFAVHAIWRQQLTDDHGIIRSNEVRLSGEAEQGPYEQHDLSAFATREDHAVKVAAYIRAKRKFTTHTATVSCRSIDFPLTLQSGDIVRLKLHRSSDIAASDLWDYLYQIERITKTAAGDVTMDLVHFPINASGVSPIALAVVETFGPGILLPSNRTGVSCDASPSRATDTTVPAEFYVIGSGQTPQYIYGGGTWETPEQVPTGTTQTSSPNIVYDEPIEDPKEEPKEPTPEPPPSNGAGGSDNEGDIIEITNGFVDAFHITDWLLWFDDSFIWPGFVPATKSVSSNADILTFMGGVTVSPDSYLHITPGASYRICFDWASNAAEYLNQGYSTYAGLFVSPTGYVPNFLDFANTFSLGDNGSGQTNGQVCVNVQMGETFGFFILNYDSPEVTITISNFTATRL